MAIPYNIIYKIVTGKAPFAQVASEADEKPGTNQSLGTPEDDANVARGVITIISGLWITLTDAGGVSPSSGMSAAGITCLKRVVT
jgi:hypothetical protein